MVQSQTLIGQKSIKDGNKDACVACNRPLVIPRYKSMKSWEQELLTHQPSEAVRKPMTSPTYKHPEPVTQTHVIPTAVSQSGLPATVNNQVPQRNNAQSLSSPLLMNAQLKALQLLNSRNNELDVLSVGNGTEIIDLGKYEAPSPLVSSPAEHMMTSLPPVVTVEASNNSNSQSMKQSNSAIIPRNLLLDNVPNNTMPSSSSPINKQRPISANSSSRHKSAIKDAYVLRGGFKMKLNNKGNSESVSALVSHSNVNTATGLIQDLSKGTLDTTPEHNFQRTQSAPNAAYVLTNEYSNS